MAEIIQMPKLGFDMKEGILVRRLPDLRQGATTLERGNLRILAARRGEHEAQLVSTGEDPTGFASQLSNIDVRIPVVREIVEGDSALQSPVDATE